MLVGCVGVTNGLGSAGFFPSPTVVSNAELRSDEVLFSRAAESSFGSCPRAICVSTCLATIGVSALSLDSFEAVGGEIGVGLRDLDRSQRWLRHGRFGLLFSCRLFQLRYDRQFRLGFVCLVRILAVVFF